MASLLSFAATAKSSSSRQTLLLFQTLTPTSFSRTSPISNVHSLQCFSSSTELPPDPSPAEPVTTAPVPAAADVDEPSVAPRIPRVERQRLGPDRMDDLICYMMSKRLWTTRLQNSIRELCPHFDRPLVLAVLRGARSPDHALRFFRWVEKTGFCHDRETYLEAIGLLTQASMLNHARCLLLDDMPKRSVPFEEDMFLPLIEAYGRAGIPQEAVKIFRKMPELGVERSVKSYDVFFKAILRRGRGMMAKRVFNAMRRDGVEPTLYTYNIMIWGFCLSEMMSTASRFFTEMKERGVKPDVVTYNTLISGWVRGKKMEDAEKLLAEMGSLELVPNTITYTTMIKGYVSDGKVDDALRLFGEMSKNDIHPSEKTYTMLLPGLSDDAEKAAEARKLLDVMAQRHIRPKDVSVFVKMISCLCNSSRLDEAVEVLRLIDRFRLVPDSSHYGILLESFCKAGNYGKAVEMLDELLDRGTLLAPNSPALEPSAYNPVIGYMCGNGQTKKAEVLFRQLMKNGIDDSVAFNHLIRGHASEGAPESALELFAIMNRRGVALDADAYFLLVESFLKRGEPADAKNALDSMLENGHLPSSSLFRSVMESLFEDGRVQTASRVMKSMIEKGVKENMDMVHKILEALLMRGHVEEALGRINLMMLNDCFPDFDSLLVALCDKDKTIAALKLVDFGLERDCEISFSSYDQVLDALYSAGKTLNAYSLLCKIKKKGGHTNKKAAAALIKSLIDEGNTKQADILSRLLFPDTEKRGRKATEEAI